MGNMDKKVKAYFSKTVFVVAKSSVVMHACLIFFKKIISYWNSNQTRKHTKLTLILSVSTDIEEKLIKS